MLKLQTILDSEIVEQFQEAHDWLGEFLENEIEKAYKDLQVEIQLTYNLTEENQSNFTEVMEYIPEGLRGAVFDNWLEAYKEEGYEIFMDDKGTLTISWEKAIIDAISLSTDIVDEGVLNYGPEFSSDN